MGCGTQQWAYDVRTPAAFLCKGFLALICVTRPSNKTWVPGLFSPPWSRFKVAWPHGPRPWRAAIGLRFSCCLIPTWGGTKVTEGKGIRVVGRGHSREGGASEALGRVLEKKSWCVWSRIISWNIWEWCSFCGVNIPQLIIVRVSCSLV